MFNLYIYILIFILIIIAYYLYCIKNNLSRLPNIDYILILVILFFLMIAIF